MPQQNANTNLQLEHNKKWRCYLLICVTSLTNFVSIGETFDVDLPQHYFGKNGEVNFMFGIVTFAASLIILIFDLIGFIRNKFDFKSLKDGRVEGYTLLVFLLWWVCGVISITRAGSVGYAALNIYLSAWASLFACLDALNRWGGEKDILTFHQLTRISITLPSWWIVFWASVVVLGSAADARRLATTPYVFDSCSVAIAVGNLSSIISAFFILSHYEFFQCCLACTSWLSYGGWLELACSILVNIFLVIGLELLTGAGRIASTVTGNGGSDPAQEDYVPGSNIYLAIWTAFIASVRVTVKWKEARAIRFAQTSGGNVEGGGDIGEDEEAGIDDNDSDV
ncbi:hypothetical protein ACHAXR_005006 [Thalassiosira sp. AJA248-18]